MIIVVSPTKNMKEDMTISPKSTPVLLEKTKSILEELKKKTKEELEELWKTNPKITQENLSRLERMDLNSLETPAIYAYDGIAFKHMAPNVFTDKEIAYINAHLRILSGFYGVLKPMDGITPYRLEMGAYLQIGNARNLYEFYKDTIYLELKKESNVILNLASKEYAKCIETYIQDSDTFITADFLVNVNGKLVTKATLAKMARGSMVRYMAEQNIENVEDIQKFREYGFVYHSALSTKTKYVFVKN